MISHRYEFDPRQVIKICLLPLLPVLVFAGLMHGGLMLRIWPQPRPTLDTDQTILVHQAEATLRANPAELVLVGDSSCLMDVDASQLAALLGHETLNLGTLSFLD